MIEAFVENTKGELTKDECLEQFLDAYREGGVYGVVEKLCSYTNMTPKYAKTVGSIATLATGIGAIYMAWKGGESIAQAVADKGTEIKWYHKLLGF